MGLLYIFASDRILLALLQDPDRLTANQTLKGWAFVILSSVLLYVVTAYGLRQVRAAERRRRRSDERYRLMIENTNEGVLAIDENVRTSFVNETMARMLGYERHELLGRPLTDFVSPDCSQIIEDQLVRRQTGERSQYECKMLRRDGSQLWTIITSAPIITPTGAFGGAFKMITDISEQKKSEEALRQSITEQRRLLNELDHRVRNNLSSVLGLLQIARSSTPGAEALAESVSGRVKAMSRAYSLLSASGWTAQDLSRLIGTLVPGEMRDRVHLRGVNVNIPAHQAGALAIVVHELLVNAAQHGALSSDIGTIDIAWSRIDANGPSDAEGSVRLELEWTERDGPLIDAEPAFRSGCRLVVGLVASDLRGSTNLNFTKYGARHTFLFELAPREADATFAQSSSQATGSTS